MVITNNPLTKEKIPEAELIEGSMLQVLTVVRDYVHKGKKLLTHPLSGSIKPNETPYKTLILSNSSSALDIQSLEIIEEAIFTVKKFMEMKEIRPWSDDILSDFQLIDYDLIKYAYEISGTQQR